MRVGGLILRLLLCSALVAILTQYLWGQASKTTAGFEVASIRPHDPVQPTATVRFFPSGEVWITGLTIRNVILLVHDLRDYQLSGGPNWLDTEVYDIRAKSQPPASPRTLLEDQKGRLRTLLADRLQLRVHHEQRTASVYYLNIAKGGLKLPAADKNVADAKGSVTPWAILVSDLSQRLDRPIIDNLHLNGSYYVALRYTTDQGEPSGIGVGRIDQTDPAVRLGPSIFAALQQQLGLRLDPGKGSLDVLVIDHVGHPSPN